MSEVPKQRPEQPNILQVSVNPENPDSVFFLIAQNTTGAEALATLRYIEPRPDALEPQLENIIEIGIERGYFNGLQIVLGTPLENPNDQVAIGRYLRFGKDPTKEDIIDGLRSVYGFGEEALLRGYEEVFVELVNIGGFKGPMILRLADFLTPDTEEATDQEAALADELRSMTDFYRTQGDI